MNWDATTAPNAAQILIIRGTGYPVSATRGESIVIVLATMLQYPKTEATNNAKRLTYNDKIIISHKSLLKEMIKNKDLVKISIMFI